VKVVRDPEWNGPWPSEPTGAIAEDFRIPFSFVDLREPQPPDARVADTDPPLMRTFMVRFDEPAHDTSTDGPYHMAEVWEKYLREMD
jgi:hypothetical protein